MTTNFPINEVTVSRASTLANSGKGHCSHHRNRPLSVGLRFTSWVMIGLQLLMPYDSRLFAATTPAPQPPTKAPSPVAAASTRIGANRTVPEVKPPSLVPEFSANPSDLEFFHAHVFGGGFVPIGGKTSPEENRDLAAALLAFSNRSKNDDFSSITNFLDQHPDSPWRAALLLNLGKVYYDSGYFSRAITAFEEGWKLSESAERYEAKIIADDTVGRLASLYAQLGRVSSVEALIAELKGRDLTGSATERLSLAREGLAIMKNLPAQGFMCGPAALVSVRDARGESEVYHKVLRQAQSTPKGTSLAQLKQWSDEMNMSMQMAMRTGGAEIPLPAVIHWKSGHFAALLKKEGDSYLMKDPVFKTEMWMSQAAVDDESSGYFLIADGKLSKGWNNVSAEVAAEVWGSGPGVPGNDNNERPDDVKCKDCPKNSPGMAQYNVHAAVVALNIFDTPIGYQPPRGKAVEFTLTYNQREVTDFGALTFANLGPKFNYNYFSYVKSDPASTATVEVYVQGGGKDTYTGYNATTLNYALQQDSKTILHRNSATNYVRSLPGGGKEIFDVAMPLGTKYAVLLTKIIDPFGNTNSLTYDANYRLVSITDAVGQVTTIDYVSTNSADTVWFYKIARVTDPFTNAFGLGRSASFAYETNSPYRLTQITDVIGVTSQFTWTNNQFVSSLTTPYGTTSFVSTEATTNGSVYMRALEVTDPEGNKERTEFQGLGLAGYPSTETAPTNLLTINNLMHYRDTFFWDKKAMREAPGDYTKAKVFHWLHTSLVAGTEVSHILESEKSPLESRVWYNYPGQSQANVSTGITNASPSKVARVLDDGSTQLYQYEYTNSFGKVTKSIDPIGRTTIYKYDTNGIDLLEVRQVLGATNELLSAITYNAQHLPLTMRDAAGQTNSFAYNSYGQLTNMINALGQTVTMSYDHNGYLTNTTGSLPGSTTSFTYDGCGRVRTMTDSEGYMLTYDYDDANRITKITHPDQTFEQTVYKNLDAILTRDRRGNWTSTSYDALRRVRDVRDSLNRVTHFEWCGCGSLESITDPMGKVTSWLRDLQGRPTAKIFPDQTQINYVYGTDSGRLIAVTDAKNQTTRYDYFKDDNLKQVTYSNAVVSTPSVSFTYDTNYNRMLTMTDGVGPTVYDYYAISNASGLGAGQLKSVDGPWSNDTIVYQYDALGRTTNRSINGVDAKVAFDSLGRVTKVDNALGTFTNTYVNATFRLSSVSNYNGLNTVFSYYGTNDDNRLQTIWHKNGSGGTVSKFDYTYDSDGQIQTWMRQADNDTPTTYRFNYDPVDQLLGAVLTSVSGGVTNVLKQYIYSYDKSGNRTGEQIDTAATGANYNNANQLTHQVSNGMTKFRGTISEAGVVDVAGNRAAMTNGTDFTAYVNTQNGTNQIQITATDLNKNTGVTNYQLVVTNNSIAKTLVYDLNGNLTSAVTSTATNTYEWDAANRFTAINVITASGTNRSEFIYDGLGRRIKIIEIRGPTTNSAKAFLWCGTELCEERDATGATVVKRFFAQGEQISGTNYFFTRDHLGSVREMVDGTGALRARYDYDPYGRRAKISGDLDADFAFTGHYYHENSGLYLTLFRGYDSETGRWLSRDPIEEKGGLNIYAYVFNDPLNAIDPFGLWNWKSIGAVSLGVAITFGAIALAPQIGFAVGVAALVGGTLGLLTAPPGKKWQGLISGAVGGAVGAATAGVIGPFLAGALGAAISDVGNRDCIDGWTGISALGGGIMGQVAGMYGDKLKAVSEKMGQVAGMHGDKLKAVSEKTADALAGGFGGMIGQVTQTYIDAVNSANGAVNTIGKNFQNKHEVE